jgi:ATP-dependent exoDNAse (exonuclease V) alpha subunit
MEQTFRIDIGDLLLKDKKLESNRQPILSIKRRALPLVRAYCITTHKSQGQTLNKVVIDLKLPNETDDIAAVYVSLSRVKRLDDLMILRHFDHKVLLIKPGKSQLAEIERLDKLYSETQKRFSDWF